MGELTIIKDLGLKEPYTGTIPLVSGEIAEDLTAYFFVSEQQNSSVALGVKVERDLSIGAAGGLIIQMLPGGDEGAVSALEEMIGNMEPLTTLIGRVVENSKGKTEAGIVAALTEDIFKDIPKQYKPEILEERNIQWKCDCSRERLEQVIMTIGKKDLKEIIEEDGKAELQCQFCLKKYNFSREELIGILNNI